MEPRRHAKTWTEGELLALDVEGTCELVEGKLIVTPTVHRHGVMAGRLMLALVSFVEEHDLGTVGGTDVGFWMKSGNLRAPDVYFVSTERARSLEVDVDRFFPAAPDLAVEVLSPSDRAQDIEKKVIEYFDSGAQSVWIVDPQAKTVAVHHPEADPILLVGSDVLTDESVLPGFSLSLARLFRPL